MSGIGYKEACAHLAGEMTLAEAEARIKTETHRLARHQNTGFKAGDPRVRWLDAGEGAREEAARLVQSEIGGGTAAAGGVLTGSNSGRFVKPAGGSDAKIVSIPTAGARYGSNDGWTAIEELHKAGAEQLEVLHTRSRSVANLAAFAAPLKEATGVWFSGGRQFRLVDVYLQTETQRELRAVLERGGVIGDNSAGASALAS